MVDEVDLTCPNCHETNETAIVGIEYQGVYDGILVWWCQTCKHQWPRFDGPGRLHDEALRHIEIYEAERAMKK